MEWSPHIHGCRNRRSHGAVCHLSSLWSSVPLAIFSLIQWSLHPSSEHLCPSHRAAGFLDPPRPPIHPSIHPSIHLTSQEFIHSSIISLSVCMVVPVLPINTMCTSIFSLTHHPPIDQFIHPSVHPPAHLSIRSSIHLCTVCTNTHGIIHPSNIASGSEGSDGRGEGRFEEERRVG